MQAAEAKKTIRLVGFERQEGDSLTHKARNILCIRISSCYIPESHLIRHLSAARAAQLAQLPASIEVWLCHRCPFNMGHMGRQILLIFALVHLGLSTYFRGSNQPTEPVESVEPVEPEPVEPESVEPVEPESVEPESVESEPVEAEPMEATEEDAEEGAEDTENTDETLDTFPVSLLNGNAVVGMDQDRQTKMLVQLKASEAIVDACEDVVCGELKCPTGFTATKYDGHCCAYCVNPAIKIEPKIVGATGKFGAAESDMCPYVWCFPTMCEEEEIMPTTDNGQCCPVCPK